MLEETFKRIESLAFDALVNIASDSRTVLRIISSDDAVKELIRLTADNKGAGRDLLDRALALCRTEFDPEYANPSDAPLATYLYALQLGNPDSASILADAVMQVSNCWWAAEVAQDVLRQPTETSSQNEATIEQTANMPTRPAVQMTQKVTGVAHRLGRQQPVVIRAQVNSVALRKRISVLPRLDAGSRGVVTQFPIVATA